MSDRLDVIRERIDTETYVFNMRSDLEWLLEQGAALTEANKLLEQTIEVLEGLATAIDFYFVHEDGEGEKRARGLYESRQAAHALLDNLKAREKNHGSA